MNDQSTQSPDQQLDTTAVRQQWANVLSCLERCLFQGIGAEPVAQAQGFVKALIHAIDQQSTNEQQETPPNA